MSPITKSAKKALRQNIKKRMRNLRKKREIKKLLKQALVSIEQKKIKQAQELLPQIYKKLDKAAKTGLIKKNKSARIKSRLNKKINNISKEK